MFPLNLEWYARRRSSCCSPECRVLRHTHTYGSVSQNYTAAKGRVHPWNEPESVDENNNYRLKVSPLTASVSLSSSAGGFQGSGRAEESLLLFLFGSSCPPHPQNPEQFVLLLRRCSSLCKQYFLGGWLGVGLGEGPLLNLQHTETNKQLRIINSVAPSAKHGWRPGRGEDWRTAEILRGCFAGECHRKKPEQRDVQSRGREEEEEGGGRMGRKILDLICLFWLSKLRMLEYFHSIFHEDEKMLTRNFCF